MRVHTFYRSLVTCLLACLLVMLSSSLLFAKQIDFSFNSEPAGSGAKLRCSVFDDEDNYIIEETAADFVTKSFNTDDYNLTFPFYVELGIPSYDSENYNFLGWQINGKDSAEFSLPGHSLKLYYIKGKPWVSCTIDKLENLTSLTITAKFEKKGSITFTPTVKAPAEYATLGENALSFIKDNDGESTRWKFAPTINEGYELSYIQVGEDEKTRVYSEDGGTITWDVTTNDEYTAYFNVAKPHIDSENIIVSPVSYGSGVASNSHDISDGQRVGFRFDFFFGCEITNKSTIKSWLYAGEGTDGKLLANKEYKRDNKLKPLTKTSSFFVLDPMPGDLEKVTVAVQLNDGEVVTKTYPITVQKSGKTDLDFLTVPQTPEMRSSYPTNVKTSIGGPNIYDAVSFLDEATGELHLYLGGSGGVYKTDKDAATDLILMDGMRFPYRDNEHMSGYAFAVGGEDEDHLAALVYDGSNLKVNPIVCIYTCTDGVWSKVENSETSDYGRFFTHARGKGLVIAADNIWTPKSHCRV